jgi:hypothetical protein
MEITNALVMTIVLASYPTSQILIVMEYQTHQVGDATYYYVNAK